ncbi:MAG: nicotinate-nucleotide adenylyltransferase [Clostridia bacterium]
MGKWPKIGVMGGTFDPIHLGHLVLAESVRESLELQEVIFVPTALPPHKELINITNSKHRYEMVKNAIATNPFFSITDFEIQHEDISYTIDTIKHLMEKNNYEVDLFFITGADALMQILTWRDIEELLVLCNFVAATRPGTNISELKTFMSSLPMCFQEKIQLLVMPALDISSTLIRQRINKGKSIKYLVTAEVEEYIYEHELYQ